MKWEIYVSQIIKISTQHSYQNFKSKKLKTQKKRAPNISLKNYRNEIAPIIIAERKHLYQVIIVQKLSHLPEIAKVCVWCDWDVQSRLEVLRPVREIESDCTRYWEGGAAADGVADDGADDGVAAARSHSPDDAPPCPTCCRWEHPAV